MQHKATPALTAVAPKRVDTLMLTATVLLGALIFVWGSTEDTTLMTAPFEDWQIAAPSDWMKRLVMLCTALPENSPEKNCALKPFLDTVLSDLNSMRMLLYWEVIASGFSAPQNFPCSLESADSPLRTST